MNAFVASAGLSYSKTNTLACGHVLVAFGLGLSRACGRAEHTHKQTKKGGGLVNSRFRVCDRRPELRPDHRASRVFEVGDVIQRVVQARGDSVNIIREKSSNIDPRHAEVSSLNLSHSSTWPRSFTKKSKLNCTQSLVLLTAPPLHKN